MSILFALKNEGNVSQWIYDMLWLCSIQVDLYRFGELYIFVWVTHSVVKLYVDCSLRHVEESSKWLSPNNHEFLCFYLWGLTWSIILLLSVIKLKPPDIRSVVIIALFVSLCVTMRLYVCIWYQWFVNFWWICLCRNNPSDISSISSTGKNFWSCWSSSWCRWYRHYDLIVFNDV